MDYNFLKIENTGGIMVLKISAPKSLNALNSTILKELDSCIDNIDASTRVLIITGDGEKSFVAGADISEMAHLNEQQGYEFGKLGAAVFRKIETLPIPVIAAVNGFAGKETAGKARLALEHLGGDGHFDPGGADRADAGGPEDLRYRGERRHRALLRG